MVNGIPEENKPTWSDVLISGQNQLGLTLRNVLKWAPGQYQEKAEYPAALFSDCLETAKKAEALQHAFNLRGLASMVSAMRYREILSYLEWLTIFQQKQPEWFENILHKPEFHWLDVGAKNWAYVNALYGFIQANRSDEFSLDGIELDPNRRYVNFKTRKQAALAFIQTLPQANYHIGNAIHWHKPAHIISHFLPFVFKDPHLAWGLPLTHFTPQRLLEHLLSLLEPNGLMLIVNQGQTEAEAQAQLLQKAASRFSIQYESLGQLPANFIEYQYPRYGWLCTKE
jgi:hypothetical protein